MRPESLPAHPIPLVGPIRVVRAVFASDISAEEIRGTLEIARLATETRYNPVVAALDAEYGLDPATRTAWIDTGSQFGREMAIVFLGLAQREFGAAAVTVQVGKGAA